MKVRDLEGWPPQPGGPFEPFYFVPASEQAIVKEVITSHRNWVTFTGSFGGKDLTYDFETPDKTFALQLKEIIKANTGRTLLEIGNIDIPSA